MKQILQELNRGTIDLIELPCPSLKPKHLLIRTEYSLVSPGTERMLVEFGKSNLLSKARKQPEKVRMVCDKIKTDGLYTTMDAVRSKLDEPLALGYSNVGVVLDVGEGVEEFAKGDRVLSNGPHAEVVCAPKNLCARIPGSVSPESAVFGIIGSIALQGIRLASPTLGETFVVTGLGLIGLLTVQLLRANGCQVLGIDVDASRLSLAQKFGAEIVDISRGEDPIAAAEAFTKGRGVDGVLITAATKSNEPVHQAALMCRKRGRIILVGVTGLQLNRSDFYEKELTFQVSCSYGPGRYDPKYEDQGHDYPIGYVRWTEKRNFEAILDQFARGTLRADELISHRFPFSEVQQAYSLLASDEPSLGILLEYEKTTDKPSSDLMLTTVQRVSGERVSLDASEPVVGFVGAGNFASRILMPAFKKSGAALEMLCTSGSASTAHYGRKFDFSVLTTDPSSIFADDRINTVVIATRHDSHARLVCQALQAGKHVFVEKPLALTQEELDEIQSVYVSNLKNGSGQTLMVGFNRRFAKLTQQMKGLLNRVKEPKSFVLTVNAGMIPSNHWTQDRNVGGGRIIGEACHFIDLLRFLVGHKITDFHTSYMGGDLLKDKAMITLYFADGSIGAIHYLANGHKSFPKERLEVFCGGRVLQLDNFRKLRGFGWPGFKKMNLWRQDKGHFDEVQAFLNAVKNGVDSPIPFEEICEVTKVTLEVANGSQS